MKTSTIFAIVFVIVLVGVGLGVGLGLGLKPTTTKTSPPPTPSSFTVQSSQGLNGFISALSNCNKAPNCTVTLGSGIHNWTDVSGDLFSFVQFTTYTSDTSHQVKANKVIVVGAGSDPNTNDGGTLLLMGGRTGGMFFAGLDSVELRDFSIDMKRTFYTKGIVTSITSSSVILQVICGNDTLKDDCSPPAAGTGEGWLNRLLAAFELNTTTHTFSGGLDLYFDLDTGFVEWTDSTTMTLTSTLSMSSSRLAQMKVGHTYVIRHAGNNNGGSVLSFINIGTINLNNIAIFSGPGTATLAMESGGTGGITYDNVRVMKRYPGRAMSTNADAFHINSVPNGPVVIKNCLAEYMGDDGVNVYTILSQVMSVNADSHTVVVTNSAGDITQLVYNGDYILKAGSNLTFFNRDTLQPIYTGLTVTTSTNNTITLPGDAPFSQLNHAIIVKNALLASSLQVTDSIFRFNRGRGILSKVPNTNITGNIFQGLTSSGVLVNPDGCYWLEGIRADNLLIRRNQFLGCNVAPIAGFVLDTSKPADVVIEACVPYYNDVGKPLRDGHQLSSGILHHNIIIRENTFDVSQRGQAAVAAFNVDGFTFRNNLIQGENWSWGSSFIYVASSINVEVPSGENGCTSSKPGACVATVV
jgi:hypothetical protein